MLVIASEAQEQRALVQWIKTQPEIRDYVIKLNNEGKRSPQAGRNLKLLGLLPGASDLFIAYPSNHYHGLWLEIKCNRKYSESEMRTKTWTTQIQFLSSMKSVGFAGDFCYGWEHGMRIIEDYLAKKY